jgi:hypothetical protein
MPRVIERYGISGRLKSSRAGVLAIVVLCLAAGNPLVRRAGGDEQAGSSADREKVKAERAARLEAMRLRATSLTAKFKNAAAEFVDAELVNPPLLTYNNHANVELDATLWAWGKTGRPIAVAAIHEDRGPKNVWSCEMVSLADLPISIAAKPGWEWTPASSGVAWKTLPGAPAAGKTAVARSAQIKDIANRFSSTGHYRNGNIIELRLMGRPLHRYADPEKGLVDGALIGFVEGTNPETLLLIECRGDNENKPTWHYGFARMSGGHLIARLEETIVWECPDIRGFDPKRPYSSYNGPEEIVFGSFTEAPRSNDE